MQYYHYLCPGWVCPNWIEKSQELQLAPGAGGVLDGKSADGSRWFQAALAEVPGWQLLQVQLRQATNLSGNSRWVYLRLVSTPSLVPQRCRVVNRENYVSDLLVLRSSELLVLLVPYVCMSSNLLLSWSIPPRPRLLMQENETHEFGPGTWLTRQRCFGLIFFHRRKDSGRCLACPCNKHYGPGHDVNFSCKWFHARSFRFANDRQIVWLTGSSSPSIQPGKPSGHKAGEKGWKGCIGGTQEKGTTCLNTRRWFWIIEWGCTCTLADTNMYKWNKLKKIDPILSLKLLPFCC